MAYVRKPFNRDMVLALLAGTKTQTRRKGKLDAFPGDIIAVTEAFWSYGIWRFSEKLTKSGKKKRSWMPNPNAPIMYAADMPEGAMPLSPVPNEPGKWRKIPPMHMPLKHSRLFLEVERSWRHKLQEMSPANAIAEGISPLFSRDDIHVPRYRAELDLSPMPYKNYLWPKDGGFSSYSDPILSYASLWDSINGGDFAWERNPEVSAYQFKVLQNHK
jgi:hypothetical protein